MDTAVASKRGLAMVLAGASLWCLVSVVATILGEGNPYMFLVLIVPATGSAYVCFRKGSKPWAWVALVLNSLALLVIGLLLVYYLASPDSGSGRDAQWPGWVLFAGSLLLTTGSIRLLASASDRRPSAAGQQPRVTHSPAPRRK